MTITGTNDAPVVAATDVTGGVTELVAPTGNLTDTGTIAFTDVDLTDVHSVSAVTPSAGALGTLTASVTTDTTDGVGGIVTWNYSVAASAVEYLAAGQLKVETFTFDVDDGEGGVVSRTVSVTITGTNDAPVVAADNNVGDAVIESGVSPGNTAFPGDASAAGNVLTNDTDVDTGDTKTVSAVNGVASNVGAVITGTYGTITIAANGSYNYSLNNADTDTNALVQGASATEVFSYTVRDTNGATNTANLTINITGTNDAPTIDIDGVAAYTTGGAAATVDSSITIADVDSANLSGATVQITGNLQTGDTLTFTSQPGITGSYNSVTGVLTLSGSATKAVYELVLESVQFSSTNSSNLQRTVSYQVKDTNGALSNLDTAVVNVTGGATLFFKIDVPGPEGQDRLGFDNFTITVGGKTYTMSDLVVVSSQQYFVPPASGTDDFALGQGGSGSRSVVFQLNNAPASGSASVSFNYTSSNNGNTTDDGPIFSIGTSATTTTVIANYSNDNTAPAWVGDISSTPRIITFNYSAASGGVTVTSVVDPIILDLGEDGISLAGSVLFDMDGDGQPQTVAWTNGQDGILVMDIDGSGGIENGREVLSPWFNGGNFVDALDALGSLDSNADGIIDSNDAAFVNLRVWIDANSDGVTDASELLTLDDVGISSISLFTVAGSGTIDGQTVLATGAFTDQSGAEGKFAAVELNETINTQVLSALGSEDVMGTDNGDILFSSAQGNSLYGSGGSDTLYGGGASDKLNGGDGNDRLIGGYGSDTLTGGAGNDVFEINAGPVTFEPTQIDSITDYASGDIVDISDILSVAAGINVIADGYLRVTATGLVQIDVDGGNDNWVTVSSINTGVSPDIRYFLDGIAATVNVTPVAPPIALDLNGDGVVSFIGTDAEVSFDYGGGNVVTAWVGPQDGLLVRDANNDGQVSANEIVFATSGSDLEGLAVYDSNGDGQLSAADDHFGEFNVWQDADSDGAVDAGELRTLAAENILSISLASDGKSYSAANGDVTVVGTGSFARSDGSIGVLADAVFQTGNRVLDAHQKTSAAEATRIALATAAAASGVAWATTIAAMEHPHSTSPSADSKTSFELVAPDDLEMPFGRASPHLTIDEANNAYDGTQSMPKQLDLTDEEIDQVELEHISQHDADITSHDLSEELEANVGDSAFSLVNAMVQDMSGMVLLTTLLGGSDESSPDEASVISNSPDVPDALIDAVYEFQIDAVIEAFAESETLDNQDGAPSGSDTSALLSILDHTFNGPDTSSIYVAADDASAQLALAGA